MAGSIDHRFSGNHMKKAVCELSIFLTIVFLLLTALPLIVYADNTKPVTVIYLYDESCHRCTEAMPVVRQAIEEAREEGLYVDYQEIRVSSREGASYIDRYSLTEIPDLIIDNHTVIGPANLEGEYGEYGTVLRDIKDRIASSYGYASPVTVHTVAEKKSESDSNVTVTVYISNQDNTAINVSLSGGLTEGSRLVSGQFYWSGPLQPGAEEKVTYVLSGGNTPYVFPSAVYYEDDCGSHVITDSYVPVSTMSVLSIPIAFASGIVAAFSPCILAVMAYIATLAASGERRHLLLINIMAFSAGLLFMYSLIGVCFYRISVTMPSMYNLAKYAIVLSMLIIGSTIIFRTLFHYERSFSDAGFRKLVALLRPYDKISMAGFSFAIGVGFGLIKMPCTGGPYLAILGMMTDQRSSVQGLYYLLAYNAGIVFPILGLGILLMTGLSTRRLDAIRIRYRAFINIATGITLFILAAVLAFSIV
jgi:cytochrome c biogenesis protein CcdA